MTAEDIVLIYDQTLRRGEPFDASFIERQEAREATTQTDSERKDAGAEGLCERTWVTGAWIDAGKRVEDDSRWSGGLEPVGHEWEWAFDQCQGSALRGN